MRVDLLYCDGCPHYAPLERRLRSLLAGAGVDAPVMLRRVRSSEEAERLRFLGSPTVRIADRDVEPGAHGRTDVGLKCRLYEGARGLRGVPDDDLIIEAIAAATASSARHAPQRATPRRPPARPG
jgi:hypothetical protein